MLMFSLWLYGFVGLYACIVKTTHRSPTNIATLFVLNKTNTLSFKAGHALHFRVCMLLRSDEQKHEWFAEHRLHSIALERIMRVVKKLLLWLKLGPNIAQLITTMTFAEMNLEKGRAPFTLAIATAQDTRLHLFKKHAVVEPSVAFKSLNSVYVVWTFILWNVMAL